MANVRTIAALSAWLALSTSALAGGPFAIEVVDSKTGRGVPLVELRTVNEIRLVTDSRGIAAFDEPGLMGRKVFFHVEGHGYTFPKDGFGYRGKALDVEPGKRAKIAVDRVNVAERLYRVTGAGIYRDSLLVGDKAPIREPVLNAQVLGQDSVLDAAYRGKMYWFWGDTNRPGYPLGNFGSPTATSALPGDGGLDPEIGVDLDYAVAADGFAAPSAALPGPGPTWLDGLTVLKDEAGRERMFAAYAKVRPSMEAYERGIAEFDPEARKFAKVAPIPLDAPIRPFGHPFSRNVSGDPYVYFADPVPLVRVRANVDDFLRLENYEAFTCRLPGSNQVDRDPDGRPRYAWRRGAKPVDAVEQARLVRSGTLDEADAPIALRDVDTGRPFTAHRGSTYWNEFRKRWVMIAVETGGTTSNLGEAWFAEADAPLGPWAYARKVVTHDKYSFYNPKQHPNFAKDGGRVIFFEGTYTTTFSGNDRPTPRYDYNQIMYKLDLADPRLDLPAAIYEVDGRLDPRNPGHPVAFYALEKPAASTVPIGDPPRFYALAPDVEKPPTPTVSLYESPGGDGSKTYTTRKPGDDARAIGRVWRSPTRRVVPAD